MAGPASVKVEIKGVARLRGALRVLGETEAPFLREAMEDVGALAARAIQRRAKGGIAGTVAYRGVRGGGALVRATVVVTHPGAKPMEFGDKFGRRGGRRRGGVAPHRYPQGQKAEPFVGVVKGGDAVGEFMPEASKLIGAAFEKEWERLAAKGPAD